MTTSDSIDTVVSDDDRNRITADSFKVSKSLMGLPLASPWQRGFALLIDLIIVGLLSGVGFLGFALVLGIVLVRSRKAPDGTMGKWVTPVLIGLLVIAFSIGFGAYYFKNNFADVEVIKAEDGTLSLSESSKVGQILRLSLAKDDADAALRAEEIKAKLVAQGVDEPLAMQMIDELKNKSHETSAELNRELDTNLHVSTNVVVDADRGANIENADLLPKSLTPAELKLQQQLTELQTANKQLTDTNDSLVKTVDLQADEIDELTASASDGIVAWAEGIIKDLGLSAGWAAVYFSAFWALWQGQTPGKRLFRLRVIQLNGEPLTFWQAFGRYGGYAAGFATGLLGFGQIFWDKNRQAIHDKIAETVVIKE